MTPMKIGIHYDIPFAEYQKIDAISGSKLFKIKKSPAHFMAGLEDDGDSPARIFGRAFHTFILEPHKLGNVLVCPEAKSRTNKKYDEMVANNPGASVILEKEQAQLIGMREAFDACKTAKAFLDGTKKEVTIVWKCRETGELCKGRLDAWNPELKTIIDVKTCGDASFFSFRNDAASYDYDLKAAWYSWGMQELGESVDASVLIAIEKEAPYGVMNYCLDSHEIKLAGFECAEMLKKYHFCKSTGKWPCYEDMVVDLAMPEWKTKELMRKFGDAVVSEEKK